MTKEYNLKFNERTLNVIGGALAKLPYEVSAGILNDIQLQVNEIESAASELEDRKADKAKK